MTTESEFNGLDTFDNVVVLMLENRSFDNLLGHLYTQEETKKLGKNFDGLDGKNIEMPVPLRAVDRKEHAFVKPHKAKDWHQPYPDPGEVYQHVNTQLYNNIDPTNFFIEPCAMKSPYNVPVDAGTPPMTGFINDYINTLQAIKCKSCKQSIWCWLFGKCKECKECESYKNPAYAEYNRIMQVYTPEMVPVLTKLARDFAVFDHWYCAVPSQTWCNRAFWHAAASGGKVQNPTNACTALEDLKAMGEWVEDVWSQPNIFQRMKDSGIKHRVYTQELISLTSIVTGFFKGEDAVVMDRELSTFKRDLRDKKLPKYSFLEPKFLGQHNDMHPSSAKPGLLDGPTKVGTVLLGEHLVWDVYNSIFTNEHYKDNTLLIITFDEHGGCFDHVAPPPHHPITKENEVVPPHPNVKGQKDFDFKRLGVRVPMIMVSSHIQPNTIMNERYDHSSFIKTVCTKWKMPHLTDRDLHANSFEGVFTPHKRDFPPIKEPKISSRDESEYDNHPLHELQQSLLAGAYFAALKYKKEVDPKVRVPSIKRVNTNKKARKYLERIRPILEKLI